MVTKDLSKIFMCLVILPTMALGQLKQDTKVNMAQALTKPNKIQSIVGLLGLDPNKFSMSHSYTLSFTSFGGQSFNQGLYLNTMSYKLVDPLTMYLQIGLQHQPFGDKFGNNQLKDQLFISGAGLEYKPSDKFKLQFEYAQRTSPYYSSYYYDSYRFNRSNSFFDQKEADKE